MSGFLSSLVTVAAISAVTAAVVWPLWYLATVHTDAYTIVSVVALATYLSWHLVMRHFVPPRARKDGARR